MRTSLRETVRVGLIIGVVALFIALIGMVEGFSQRFIVSGVVPLGITILLLTVVFGAYLAVRRTKRVRAAPALALLAFGMVLSAAVLTVDSTFFFGSALFLLLATATFISMELRRSARQSSGWALLTFGQDLPAGLLYLLLAGAVLGAAGAAIYLLPQRLQHAIVIAIVWVTMLGILQDLIRVTFQSLGSFNTLVQALYEQNGLSVIGALIIFLIIAAVDFLWNAQRRALQTRFSALPTNSQRIARTVGILIALALLLLVPQVLGIYIGEGKFIHAPRPGGEVRVEDMGFAYWARRFTGARRIDAVAAPAASAVPAVVADATPPAS